MLQEKKSNPFNVARPIQLNKHEFDLAHMFKSAKIKPGHVLRGVVLPDTHYPFHDKEVVAAVTSFLMDYKPHVLIHIGDFYEMESLSPHELESQNFKDAMRTIRRGRTLMRQFVDSSGAVYKFFCVGNHEYWFERYLEKKVPGIKEACEHIGSTMPSINSLCTFGGLDFQVIPHNEVLKLGKAHFTHGFYTNSHHAEKTVRTVGGTIFYGHTETIQCHAVSSMDGMRVGQSIGTLRDIAQAKFMRARPCDWLHGFMIIEWREDGTFSYVVPTIINSTFSFNGKIYWGN